jgi:hypothetical protein
MNMSGAQGASGAGAGFFGLSGRIGTYLSRNPGRVDRHAGTADRLSGRIGTYLSRNPPRVPPQRCGGRLNGGAAQLLAFAAFIAPERRASHRHGDNEKQPELRLAEQRVQYEHAGGQAQRDLREADHAPPVDGVGERPSDERRGEQRVRQLVRLVRQGDVVSTLPANEMTPPANRIRRSLDSRNGKRSMRTWRGKPPLSPRHHSSLAAPGSPADRPMPRGTAPATGSPHRHVRAQAPPQRAAA